MRQPETAVDAIYVHIPLGGLKFLPRSIPTQLVQTLEPGPRGLHDVVCHSCPGCSWLHGRCQHELTLAKFGRRHSHDTQQLVGVANIAVADGNGHFFSGHHQMPVMEHVVGRSERTRMFDLEDEVGGRHIFVGTSLTIIVATLGLFNGACGVGILLVVG